MAGQWITDVTGRSYGAIQKRPGLDAGQMIWAESFHREKSYSSGQFDEPMRTFIAATRTDRAAFILNGMLPESNDSDIIVFMTGALNTVAFH